MQRGFSIIIPTLNEERTLPLLLESVTVQGFKEDIEVIVVDGGSTDNTKTVALSFKKTLPQLHIFSTKAGLSRQRNKGADKAKYEYLLFIDADSILSKDFLNHLSKQIGKETDIIGLPLILPYNGNLLDYIFALGAYAFFILTRFTGPIVSGMCIVTSKSNHQRIGGFDERAVYAGDIEYGLRSHRSGATYHQYLRARIFGNTRRGQKIGRLRLGNTWLRWYFDTLRHGPITDNAKYSYEYGNKP